MRFWRIIRYSGVGVFLAGIFTFIQGCSASDIIKAFTVWMMIMLPLLNNEEDKPAVSPAGASPILGQIAYVCFDQTITKICISNADGSGTPLILSSAVVNVADQHWSPDGKKVVFLCGLPFSRSICTANTDGSGSVFNLSDTLPVQQTFPLSPRWSPDGLKIAFLCKQPHRLCIANADGSGSIQELVATNFNDTVIEWSPDGSKIAYQCNFTGNLDICTVNSNGTGSIFNLTASLPINNTNDWEPQWSPDGTKIVYVCGFTSSQFEICIANSDGTGDRFRLTASFTIVIDTNFEPQWSPDGETIVWRCNSQLCIANADGSSQQFFLSNAIGDSLSSNRPQWSPDGKRIVYDCQDTDAGILFFNSICIANADGTGERISLSKIFHPLRTSLGDGGPQWSPN